MTISMRVDGFSSDQADLIMRPLGGALTADASRRDGGRDRRERPRKAPLVADAEPEPGRAIARGMFHLLDRVV